jgi:hypothetical protein
MLLSALQPFQSTRKATKKADICEGTFSNLIHILKTETCDFSHIGVKNSILGDGQGLPRQKLVIFHT